MNAFDVMLERGTLAGLIGQAKVGKTAFIVGLMRDAVRKNPAIKILWFDTEQTQTDIKLMYKYGFAPAFIVDNITFTAARQYENADKIKVLAQDFESAEYDICILDNVTDLDSESVMERDAASRLLSFLMQVSEIKNVTILSVIHINQGEKADSTKGFGHIGSEYARKCHILIRLKKNTTEGFIDVDFQQERRKPIQPFAFRRSDENYIDWIDTNAEASLGEKLRLNQIIDNANVIASLYDSFREPQNQSRTIERVHGIVIENGLPDATLNYVKNVVIPKLLAENIDYIRECEAKGNRRLFERGAGLVRVMLEINRMDK
jgi:hypothetical protein